MRVQCGQIKNTDASTKLSATRFLLSNVVHCLCIMLNLNRYQLRGMSVRESRGIGRTTYPTKHYNSRLITARLR
jgi:hypothetical protein